MPSLWRIALGFLSAESAVLPFMNEATQSNQDSTSISTHGSFLHRPDGVPHVDASVLVTESGLLLNAGDMTFHSGLVHMNENIMTNGKVYFQREEPFLGTNKFWYQHFAPYEEGGLGRVMIEFYDQDTIVAIFKSNDDDVGMGGMGIWVQN